MKRTRRVLAWALLVLILLATVAWLARAPIAMAIGERVAARRLAADPARELPDGLHVGICGAGSPFTDERRSGPCTLVQAGQRLFVFDAGSGSARVIARMGFNAGAIEAVFLTHFHSDHIDGLGELMLQRWVGGTRREPLPVHGPPGVHQVLAGFMMAYGQDQHYRVAHHGSATVPAEGFGGRASTFTPGPDGQVVVLKDGDLEISAFMVEHRPVHPSVGYRIRYKGRSVVLSGDTKKSVAVQDAAKGADLLVHEALSPPLVGVFKRAALQANRPALAKIFDDILDYHATPEEAAETARDAGVRRLVLNHVVPLLALPGLDKAFLGRAPDIFAGPVSVALDGDFFSLLPGSTDVAASRR